MASSRLATPGIALACAFLEAVTALLLSVAPLGPAVRPWWWALAALALALVAGGASVRRRALLLLYVPLVALSLVAAAGALAAVVVSTLKSSRAKPEGPPR